MAIVRISMDVRGSYFDNIFIKRLWRILQQETIYFEEINDCFHARKVVKDWMAFHNSNHPIPRLISKRLTRHTGLD